MFNIGLLLRFAILHLLRHLRNLVVFNCELATPTTRVGTPRLKINIDNFTIQLSFITTIANNQKIIEGGDKFKEKQRERKQGLSLNHGLSPIPLFFFRHRVELSQNNVYRNVVIF